MSTKLFPCIALASLAALGAVLIYTPALRAQLAPPPPPAETHAAATAQSAPVTAPVVSATTTPSSAEDIVEMNPFTVTATEDKGYQAQNTLGGSRLKTDYRDLATPTSTFTEQFFQDLNINNLDDLGNYMLSTQYDYSEDNGNSQNSAGTSTRRSLLVRGMPVTTTVNFFKGAFDSDNFSMERIDVTRGPNAVLFGISNPGGIINLTPKRAQLNKTKGYVTVAGQSYDGIRYEGDYNLPLITDTLAIRVAGMKSQQETWKNYEYDNEERYYGTMKWRITPKAEINIEAETGQIDKLTTRNIIGYDAVTNWLAAGSPLSATAIPNVITQNGANANSIVLVTNPDPANPGAPPQVINTAGRTASWPRVTQTMPFGTIIAGDSIPITDFNLVPRETAIYGPGYGINYKYSRMAANFTYSLTKDWFLDINAARVDTHQASVDPQAASGRILEVDTNPTLPGGLPNPNAGRPYFENANRWNNTNNRDDAIRAMMTYTKDLKKWGRHTFAVSFEYNAGKQNTLQRQEYIVSPNAPNTHSANAASPDSQYDGPNQISRRTYLGRQLDDGSWTLYGVPSQSIVMADWRNYPSNGLTDTSGLSTNGRTYKTAVIPFNNFTTSDNTYEGTSTIAMLQSSFWQNRIITTLGAGYDRRKDYNSGMDIPVDADGFQLPDPNGIFDLAQTAWQPMPGGATNGKSFSGSIVWHITDWLTLSYSKAANRALPALGGRVWSSDGLFRSQRPPTPYGRTDDLSIKFDLFNRRVFATLTAFKTSDDRDFRSSMIISSGEMNAIWNKLTGNQAPANLPAPSQLADFMGDDSYSGVKSYNLLNDTSTGTVYDAKTRGAEMEIIANPTPNLRLRVAYTYHITKNYNIGLEQVAYLERWMPFWLKVDNGTTISNARPWTITNQVDMLQYMILTESTFANGREPRGQSRHAVNANVNYSFTNDVMKGIQIGGDVRYNSPNVTGYFANVDDNGDFTNSQTTWGTSNIVFGLMASYNRKISIFGKALMWQLYLRVDNVFNNDKLLPVRMARDADSFTMTSYKFNPPRAITVRTTFRF